MTNERIFKIITKLKRDYLDDNFDLLYVDKLLDELRENLKKDYQKSKGLKHGTVLKNLFKNSYNKTAVFMNKAIIMDNNKFGFTNGFSAYYLNDDYGYDKIENKNLQDLINKFKEDYKENESLYHKINIDIVDLKLHIADNKAVKKNEPYIITNYSDGTRLGVNANYLLDILSIIETNTVYFKNPHDAIYCENVNNEYGILCPIRLKD